MPPSSSPDGGGFFLEDRLPIQPLVDGAGIAFFIQRNKCEKTLGYLDFRAAMSGLNPGGNLNRQ